MWMLFQRAMLIYRNSIDPETKASPATIIFGHPIRDPIPIPLGRYCPHQTWQETLSNRERALAKRHSREHEKWSQNTRELKTLEVGDHVYLQNLTGNNPLRWDRTGVVLELKPFKQYAIKVDGSGRVTLRNRKHLRKFTPFYKPGPLANPEVFLPPARLNDSNNRHPNPEVAENPEHGPELTENTETPSTPTTITGDDPNCPAFPRVNINAPVDANTPAFPKVNDVAPVTPMPEVSVPAAPDQTTCQKSDAPAGGKKIPLALRRLFPHNKSGRLEG